ncbi:PREDICTED: polyubiquitin-A [Prunus dulcis]|uniref:PREDICTED: polyubiquitin-A n=1 Tax=Prunus dulcis TaxID=3755 RepID=A0A5E4ES11_PRUDU|nr:PREDICTED: polyubiquitin-A [Prunus dulcis]
MNYLPPATSLITFLWSGGESILLVPMATRIMDVKLLISEVLRIPIPIDRQELSWEGQCLKDELTLQDYHIPPTAFLVIYKKIEVEIYLEFDGHRYVYVVFDGITVGELKAKLQTEQGVDIEDKVLWMVDNSYLDDHAQLLVAGVVEGAKLFLIEDKKRM